MTIIGFALGLFMALACVKLVISYAQIGSSTRRALEIRLRGRAWFLTTLLSLVWPVALVLLAAGDLLRRDESRPLLMDEGTYRSKILAQEGAAQLQGEAEVRRVHVEWQDRVNHFYALGAEAEEAKDWLTAQAVAENLDFLLETEPPRPPEKIRRKVLTSTRKNPKPTEPLVKRKPAQRGRRSWSGNRKTEKRR
jgi:hypothetical protein